MPEQPPPTSAATAVPRPGGVGDPAASSFASRAAAAAQQAATAAPEPTVPDVTMPVKVPPGFEATAAMQAAATAYEEAAAAKQSLPYPLSAYPYTETKIIAQEDAAARKPGAQRRPSNSRPTVVPPAPPAPPPPPVEATESRRGSVERALRRSSTEPVSFDLAPRHGSSKTNGKPTTPSSRDSDSRSSLNRFGSRSKLLRKQSVRTQTTLSVKQCGFAFKRALRKDDSPDVKASIRIDASMKIFDIVSQQKELVFPPEWFGDLVELLERCIDEKTIVPRLRGQQDAFPAAAMSIHGSSFGVRRQRRKSSVGPGSFQQTCSSFSNFASVASVGLSLAGKVKTAAARLPMPTSQPASRRGSCVMGGALPPIQGSRPASRRGSADSQSPMSV